MNDPFMGSQFVCNVLVAPKQEPTLNVQVIATARVPILIATALSAATSQLCWFFSGL